jgi:hypothetical protein
MEYNNDLKDEFFANITKTDLCWIWNVSKNRQGYGVCTAGGLRHSAHRVSWTLHYGAIPKGMLVCHRCDNPSCVKPDHLFIGTHSDNSRDAYYKGRLPHLVKGQFKIDGVIIKSRPRALSSDQVIEIKRLYNHGIRQRDLAKQFKVRRNTIWRVVNDLYCK